MLDDLDVEEEEQKQIKRKSVKACIIMFALSIIIIIFLPSKKDMYIIYGVGKTIDWVKSNDKAEQLPDKAVKALDAFLDDYCKKNEKNPIKTPKSDKNPIIATPYISIYYIYFIIIIIISIRKRKKCIEKY